ncbi:MAG: site-2 protease family protein [Deinococcales bacterium]
MMLLNLLQGPVDLSVVVISITVMLFALIFHNVVQAWLASRYGDSTPRYAGFLSFDPQRHLDLMGVLFLMLLGLGWTVPIPVNSRNYRGRGYDEVKVWYSGPLAFLLVAFVSTIIAALFARMDQGNLTQAFLTASYYSVLHAVIHLFPVWPLDGARAALASGNRSLKQFVYQIQSYGNLGFLVFFLLMGVLGITGNLIDLFQGIISRLVGFVL